MLQTGVSFRTWLDQPDGVIETAVELLTGTSAGGVTRDAQGRVTGA